MSNISGEPTLQTADPALSNLQDEPLIPSRPLWLETLARIFRRKPVLIALVILLAIVASSILAPQIAPYDPLEMHQDFPREPPSTRFLLGTDEIGRDLFSRVLYAGRPSLILALMSVLLAMTVGTILGLVSGYGGAVVDAIIMRITDAVIAFPWLLMAILIVSVLGPGPQNTILAIAFIGIPGVIRMTRATVLVQKQMEYVLAARIVGGSELSIALRHILPNILPSSLVVASLTAATAIQTEAAVGFLGLGIQPPDSSWGLLLRRGYQFYTVAPWYISSTAIVVTLTIWSLNTLGDGLRDALDPRLRGVT